MVVPPPHEQAIMIVADNSGEHSSDNTIGKSFVLRGMRILHSAEEFIGAEMPKTNERKPSFSIYPA